MPPPRTALTGTETSGGGLLLKKLYSTFGHMKDANIILFYELIIQ